jgi:hypothetical protein
LPQSLHPLSSSHPYASCQFFAHQPIIPAYRLR